jgi:DNA-directed RNA polymerase beta' subunit
MKELMHVSKHIVTPSTNRPLISAVQDTVIGAYLMTKKDAFFARGEFMQLMMVCRYQSFELPPPAIVHPTPLWTGKQVFSHVIPARTTTVRSNGSNKSYFGPFRTTLSR